MHKENKKGNDNSKPKEKRSENPMKMKWIVLSLCLLAVTAATLCYLYFFRQAPEMIEGVLI